MKRALLLLMVLASGALNAKTCEELIQSENPKMSTKRVLECKLIKEQVGLETNHGKVIKNIFGSPKLCVFETGENEFTVRAGGDNGFAYIFGDHNDVVTESNDDLYLKMSSMNSHGVRSVNITNVHNLSTNNPTATLKFYETFMLKKDVYYEGEFSCSAIH